jgi:quinol monooxygenase YgiN
MGVIFAIMKVFPPARQQAQVMEILRSVQDLARPTPGCTGCWVSEESFPHPHIRYAEQWESEESLHEHLRSPLYRRVLAAMELSTKQPEINYYYTVRERGFDLIEEVRREKTEPNPLQNSAKRAA